jgi:hypothetical protein
MNDEVGNDGFLYVTPKTFDPEKVIVRTGHADTTSPGTTLSVAYKYTTPKGEEVNLLRQNPPTETALYGATQFSQTGEPTSSTKWEMVAGWKIVEKLPEGYDKDLDVPVVERDANRNLTVVKDREREFYIHDGPTGNERRDVDISFGQDVLAHMQLTARIESAILEKAIRVQNKPFKTVVRIVATTVKTGLTGTKVTMGQCKNKKGEMVTTPTIFVGEKKTMPFEEFVGKSAGARVQMRRSYPSIFISAQSSARVRCISFTVLAKRLGGDPADKSAWMSAHGDDGVDDEGFDNEPEETAEITQPEKRMKRANVEDENEDSFFE